MILTLFAGVSRSWRLAKRVDRMVGLIRLRSFSCRGGSDYGAGLANTIVFWNEEALLRVAEMKPLVIGDSWQSPVHGSSWSRARMAAPFQLPQEPRSSSEVSELSRRVLPRRARRARFAPISRLATVLSEIPRALAISRFV